ncbi:MAG: hypothetical protein M3Z04_21065 [Chloroflexota bacterium]|nr:hypothetical protein [Chloroflexota bacterium]
MELCIRALTHPKTEHSAADNEDHLAFDLERGVFAVADGVGETSFAHQWAPVLVEQFVADPLASRDSFEVEHWIRQAQAAAQGRITAPDSLSGIAQTKARQGAAATLLGLTLLPSDTAAGGPGYRVTAVGDSTFFHWRADPATGSYDLLKAHPISESAGFNTLPDSINHRHFDRDQVTVSTWVNAPNHQLREDDILLLATDAVAQWILRGWEATRYDPIQHPMVHLQYIEDGTTDWETQVTRARRRGEMVNDDATLLLIRVRGTGALALTPADPGPAITRRSAELRTAVKNWIAGQGRDVDIMLAYGDGDQIEPALRARLCTDRTGRAEIGHLDLWRANSQAFKTVGDAVRRALRTPDDHGELAHLWGVSCEQLVRLPWARGLIQTLTDLGLAIPPPDSPPPPPESDDTPTAQFRYAVGAWVDHSDPADPTADRRIVDRYNTGSQIDDPGLKALINSRVPIGSKKINHMQLWRARAGHTRPLPDRDLPIK